jgi:hypothetical protein
MIELPVQDNGVLAEKVMVTGENLTTPRVNTAPNLTTLTLEADQDAPRRIWFTETDTGMQVESSGRAVPPLDVIGGRAR